ncbi:MAG: WbuC family cupin fold metalloprotein [Deltaproteobacteria bacterium]|nr:WbuC family cupin fold metalloprotein [Deltaproteobacteria bacterium]
MNPIRIDPLLINQVSQKARKNPRKRLNHNFHQLTDKVQRFLNAVEPESYIRPHLHKDPKFETFLILRGKGAVLIFDHKGGIEQVIFLEFPNGTLGVDIPPEVFHTLVSLAEESLFYEIKPGPFDPDADKGFADWAPEENTPESKEYLRSLNEQITRFHHHPNK